MAEGVKYDTGKNMMGLLPPNAVMAVGRILTFGASKYSPNNWYHVPGAKQRYMDAALRHIFQYMAGDTTDAETKENHLAHAMCCLAFLLEADETNWEFPPAETKSK